MSRKKKTTASADRFSFKANDPLVTDLLNAQEIAAVKNWQTSDQYSFEFHEGHTTGGVSHSTYVRRRASPIQS